METRGLGTHSVAALKLVHAAALRLALAELRDRPLLGNWDRLMDYLCIASACQGGRVEDRCGS
jgi:DNA repair protein RadC